jgi:tetratricopeptide (TPR) repeat protein
MKRCIPLLLAAALVGAACQDQSEAANRVTLGEPQGEYGGGLPAELQAHIDDGNAAYRARDYEAALVHYQAAAEKDPSQPTAWFGVAMAASALGDEERAEQARQRVQQLDPDLGASSHSAPAEAHGAPMVKPHP